MYIINLTTEQVCILLKKEAFCSHSGIHLNSFNMIVWGHEEVRRSIIDCSLTKISVDPSQVGHVVFTVRQQQKECL